MNITDNENRKIVLERYVKSINFYIYVWMSEQGYDTNNPKDDNERLTRLQELEDFISELDDSKGNIYSETMSGKSIIPYSNSYGNIYSWKLADSVMMSTEDYSYVSDTAIGKLSMDETFQKRLGDILGYKFSKVAEKPLIYNYLWGLDDSSKGIRSKSPILGSDGKPLETDVPAFVDYLSDRVMSQQIQNAKGDVFAFMSTSEGHNVFMRTELDTLIHNEDVTSINGLKREDLLDIYNNGLDDLSGRELEEKKLENLQKCVDELKPECDRILDNANIVKIPEGFAVDVSKCDYFSGKKEEYNDPSQEKMPFHVYMTYANEMKDKILNKEYTVLAKNKRGDYYESNKPEDISVESVFQYSKDEKVNQKLTGDITKSEFNQYTESMIKDLDSKNIHATPEMIDDYRNIYAITKEKATVEDIVKGEVHTESEKAKECVRSFQNDYISQNEANEDRIKAFENECKENGFVPTSEAKEQFARACFYENRYIGLEEVAEASKIKLNTIESIKNSKSLGEVFRNQQEIVSRFEKKLSSEKIQSTPEIRHAYLNIYVKLGQEMSPEEIRHADISEQSQDIKSDFETLRDGFAMQKETQER